MLKGCVPLRGYAKYPSLTMNDARDSMAAPRLLHAGRFLLAACLAPVCAQATSVAEITSISSVAAPGYVREKLPDGTWKPETFAFGQGGHMVARTAGDAIDKLSFDELVKLLAAPLSRRNYRQADEPADTNLLIMIYMGDDQRHGRRVQFGRIPEPAGQPERACASAHAGGRRRGQGRFGVNRGKDDADERNQEPDVGCQLRFRAADGHGGGQRAAPDRPAQRDAPRLRQRTQCLARSPEYGAGRTSRRGDQGDRGGPVFRGDDGL